MKEQEIKEAMTPKEKAEQLVLKHMCTIRGWDIDSQTSIKSVYDYSIEKECALIAVDELIENVKSVDSRPPNYQTINEGTKEYWKQVKNEIYKL